MSPTPPVPEDASGERTLIPSSPAGDETVASPPDSLRTVIPSSSAPSRALDTRALQGEPFGRYRLLEELGHGGMGIVWKAWDTKLQRLVALKQILAREDVEAAQVERFQREARIAARLRHPNIVAVYDVGAHEGQHYFTTELIEGRPLDSLPERPSTAQSLAWTRTIAEALAYAHAQGVVHRDIKPGNILIDSGGRPFVMDFGLAKDVRLSSETGSSRFTLTASGALVGTPQYMSPEQAMGRTDAIGPATDQFSLGVVLYELLTGKPPFEGKGLRDLLNAIAEQDPVPPRRIAPGLPADAETICLRALAKVPSERYPGMADLAEDLARHIAGDPIRARGVPVLARLKGSMRRNRLAATLVALAACAVLATATVLTWQARRRAIAEPLRASARAASAHATSAKEWCRARDAWQSLLALFPDDTEAAQGFAHANEAIRRKEEARADALRILEDARPLVDKASRLRYSADARPADIVAKAEPARRQLEQAVEKAPDLAQAHLHLGRALELLGLPKEAEAEWREAIRLEPKLVAARTALAMQLLHDAFEEGRSDIAATWLEKGPHAQALVAEAREQIEAALALPDWGDVQEAEMERTLARAYLAYFDRDGDKLRPICAEAIRRFANAEGVEELLWLRGFALAGKERIQTWDDAIRIRPVFADAWFVRGSAHWEEGNIDLAAKEWRRAVEQDPHIELAWLNLGNAEHKLGREDAAVEDAMKAIELAPDDPDPWILRSAVHLWKGEMDAALSDADRGVEIDPSRAQSLEARGTIRRARRDLVGARQDFEKATQLDPHGATAWLKLGQTCRQQKDEAAAKGALEHAVSEAPDDAEGWNELGAAKRALGDPRGAIEDLDRAVRLSPQFPDALANRGLAKGDLNDRAGCIADLEAALAAGGPSWPNRAAVQGTVEGLKAGR